MLIDHLQFFKKRQWQPRLLLHDNRPYKKRSRDTTSLRYANSSRLHQAPTSKLPKGLDGALYFGTMDHVMSPRGRARLTDKDSDQSRARMPASRLLGSSCNFWLPSSHVCCQYNSHRSVVPPVCQCVIDRCLDLRSIEYPLCVVAFGHIPHLCNPQAWPFGDTLGHNALLVGLVQIKCLLEGAL